MTHHPASTLFEHEYADHIDAMHAFVRDITCPAGWAEMDPRRFANNIFGGRRFTSPGGLLVALTVDDIREAEWVHLSVSRRSRTPTYEDLLLARRAFLGELRPAYQVFPRRDEYRSLPGATVLHLWMPLGADPFPDPHGERANMVAP